MRQRKQSFHANRTLDQRYSFRSNRSSFGSLGIMSPGNMRILNSKCSIGCHILIASTRTTLRTAIASGRSAAGNFKRQNKRQATVAFSESHEYPDGQNNILPIHIGSKPQLTGISLSVEACKAVSFSHPTDFADFCDVIHVLGCHKKPFQDDIEKLCNWIPQLTGTYDRSNVCIQVSTVSL